MSDHAVTGTNGAATAPAHDQRHDMQHESEGDESRGTR
jgi:hypothetical protein